MPPHPEMHPEIKHIVTVLEQVRDRSGLAAKTLKLSQETHKVGDKRLKNFSSLPLYARAIWHEARERKNGALPTYVQNYFDGPEGNGPSVQWAFKVLEHVGKIDAQLIKDIKRAPHLYEPKEE